MGMISGENNRYMVQIDYGVSGQTQLRVIDKVGLSYGEGSMFDNPFNYADKCKEIDNQKAAEATQQPATLATSLI